MTRKELVRHILKTYGQKATANGKEAWAVIRPLRKQSDEAPQCYLYTGTPDQKLLTGDLVQVGTEWYRVTARMWSGWKAKACMCGPSCAGRGDGLLHRGGSMNQDDYLDWADRLSEELERDVRRYPQELKEEEP